ncbi:transmembrane amino acid transporter protein-domain-containing protein [Diplogelasinospora grovesii]|uniref:Transmembrane amino acid transporter protein-domain-containing protein n=1 Tax=Diplogelasinospora grovesii TaxID=303347 RepID=A0AAN6N371_9PEZI|nr:transmembrane amino acid transporter protein-domain-containing protein [Diplogelasinospora grovesii]
MTISSVPGDVRRPEDQKDALDNSSANSGSVGGPLMMHAEQAGYDVPAYTTSSPSVPPMLGAMVDPKLTDSDAEKQIREAGENNFHRLGWKRLTVVLIVEAIALGALSLPSAFATLGMVAGVICTVFLGIIAMYTSYVVGQLKLKYPHISHYADAGQLMFGRLGYELVGGMFTLQLVFIVGSHILTGTIMWDTITSHGTCSIVLSVVSAIILFFLAIPPAFAEVAILGYIDFVSIIVAILVTMVATGVQSSHADGGLAAVNWSAWPKPDLGLAQGFIAIANIVFAYSFALCQFSFMDEMHTPSDYPKSIYALGLIEILIYTLTGSIVYAFVGQDVGSPALLSAGPLLSKIVFGLAIPVIFISGSINTTVVARYLHGRMFKNSVIRYINTPMGWATWLGLIAIITVVAWVIAEAIPFFEDLLAVCSSLFISGFTFYFPAIMWFMFIREEGNGKKWYQFRGAKDMVLIGVNLLCLIIGLIVLGVGTYAAIQDIIDRYHNGTVSSPFSCSPVG